MPSSIAPAFASSARQPTLLLCDRFASTGAFSASFVLSQPTHRVPSGGLAAWDVPDGSRPPVSQLPGDLELVVEASAGAWSQVRAANGWRGWVDGRLLTPAPTA